jgi:dTDP-L-rhamnose 4-epimerase
VKTLVVGGAGFIGSHLVDALVEHGHDVRVLDNLEPQVHGSGRRPPAYLNPEAEFMLGDVRDQDAVRKALSGVDAVFYQAAAVGVAQSMYEISRYVATNSSGAAQFLEVVASLRSKPRKMVVASSMTIYGEGKYECQEHGVIYPAGRDPKRIAVRQWEPVCDRPGCGRTLRKIPTDELTPLRCGSIYAITKRDHEELFLCVGRAYNIPTVALRYFNVYGARQALSNPYAGAAAIFASRALNGRPPIVYEDGRQSRDFVHVSDVVRANLLALKTSAADGQAINIGTGQAVTLFELAKLLTECLGSGAAPEVTGQWRVGDTRHCLADIGKARRLLGYEPQVTIVAGVKMLAEWARLEIAEDHLEEAAANLSSRGLVV